MLASLFVVCPKVDVYYKSKYHITTFEKKMLLQLLSLLATYLELTPNFLLSIAFIQNPDLLVRWGHLCAWNDDFVY